MEIKVLKDHLLSLLLELWRCKGQVVNTPDSRSSALDSALEEDITFNFYLCMIIHVYIIVDYSICIIFVFYLIFFGDTVLANMHYSIITITTTTAAYSWWLLVLQKPQSFKFMGHLAQHRLYITKIGIASTNHTLTCPTLHTWRNMLMYAWVATIPCKSGVSCIEDMACCGRPDDATSCNRIDKGDCADLEIRGSMEVRTSISRVKPCFSTCASWESIWKRNDNYDVKLYCSTTGKT